MLGEHPIQPMNKFGISESGIHLNETGISRGKNHLSAATALRPQNTVLGLAPAPTLPTSVL